MILTRNWMVLIFPYLIQNYNAFWKITKPKQMTYTVTWYNIPKWIERIDWKLYQNVSKKFHVAKQRRTDIYEEKSTCPIEKTRKWQIIGWKGRRQRSQLDWQKPWKSCTRDWYRHFKIATFDVHCRGFSFHGVRTNTDREMVGWCEKSRNILW